MFQKLVFSNKSHLFHPLLFYDSVFICFHLLLSERMLHRRITSVTNCFGFREISVPKRKTGCLGRTSVRATFVKAINGERLLCPCLRTTSKFFWLYSGLGNVASPLSNMVGLEQPIFRLRGGDVTTSPPLPK